MRNSSQYNRDWRAKNPGKNAECCARYRERNRDAARAAKHIAYAKDPHRQFAMTSSWFRRNHERYLFHMAKRLIARETGIRIADVPSSLAEARAMRLAVKREIKRQR